MRGGLGRSSRKAPKVQIYTLLVKTKAKILALLLSVTINKSVRSALSWYWAENSA